MIPEPVKGSYHVYLYIYIYRYIYCALGPLRTDHLNGQAFYIVETLECMTIDCMVL